MYYRPGPVVPMYYPPLYVPYRARYYQQSNTYIVLSTIKYVHCIINNQIRTLYYQRLNTYIVLSTIKYVHCIINNQIRTLY